MITRAARVMILFGASLLLFACGEKLELEIKARMDGQPAAQATVTVDGEVLGTTDAGGVFTKIIKKKPGADVEIVVAKEQAGYKIEPWKGSFLMKLPKKGVTDRYSFDAELKASRYVTIAAAEKGTPVAGATVKAAGRDVGVTDAKGEFVYEYTALPPQGADLAVTKSGYSTWTLKGPLEPGTRLEANLSKRAVVSIRALTEEYGETSSIPGISVSIDKKAVGVTDARGEFTYSYDGEPGKKVQLVLSAPGYRPASWKTTVTLEGEVFIQRYFYPTTAKAIRTGIYRFVSNTPGVDLKDVLSQTETALAAQLFRYSCFREVPSDKLQAELKSAGISIDRAVSKGWRETRLRRTVDMIVLGSVAQNEQGLLIETKFYTSGGRLIHSHIARARGPRDVAGAAKEIAAAVVEQFPFEGTVVETDGDRYKINIGKAGCRVGRGMEFSLMSPSVDESGKVAGYREIGRLVVKKTDDDFSWTEIEDIKKGERVSIGDRVVRRVIREEDEASRTYVVLLARGGVAPDVAPLSGANIYINDAWIGATNAEGIAQVPVRLGKKYDLVLYRHGYQQVVDKLRIDKSGERKEYVLQVNNSLFNLESEPSGAEVVIDGDRVGRTPLRDVKVTLGFHTVRISAGGDFRDWEEVLEFASKVEDRTGSRKIVLQKDFLKIGERAEQKGDIDGAIKAYASTEKGHPDYSEARHRLAQLYLDEKEDYDAAIREFENVLSLPENEQLIYKQYAVAFTNLGHAYYAKGAALVQKDKDAAAQNFAKAIQNLNTAKQNTRFFPNLRYDEAVHDTYYYLALSYHKLYLITKKGPILNSANLAWREYFDFFPKKLEGKEIYEQSRESAQKYWDQIKDQM